MKAKGKSGGEAGAFKVSPAGKCRLGRCREEGSAWEPPAPTGAAFSPNQAEPDEPYKNDLENKKVLLDKCWLK